MQIKNGIDLIEIDRIKKAYETFGNRMLHRLYDDSEIDTFSNKASIAKAPYLAKNFAAKEAVSKVLGTGFTNGIRPKDIVIHRGDGGPTVELNGKAASFAKKLDLKPISLSLTDTHHNAAAVATGIFGKWK